MLKIGDSVKMNKAGIRYHNPDNMFTAHNVGGVVPAKNLKELLCEFIAIQGVGKVKEINEDAIRVRFEHRLNGAFFYFTMYYEPEHISKLFFFDKLKIKLRSLL